MVSALLPTLSTQEVHNFEMLFRLPPASGSTGGVGNQEHLLPSVFGEVPGTCFSDPYLTTVIHIFATSKKKKDYCCVAVIGMMPEDHLEFFCL